MATAAEMPVRARVLVVEDDRDNREVMVELLSLVGYEVVAAADGLQALAHLRRASALPDLIILDLMMPGMNGWQLLAELKREPAWDAVRTLVVSAVAPRLLPSAGADATLVKPVSADALLAMVARLCAFPGTSARASRPPPVRTNAGS